VTISRLADARVAVLGYGLEGSAVVRALGRAGCRGIVVLSDEPLETTVDPEIARLSGEASLDAIRSVDVVIRSPGVRPTHRWLGLARALGVPVTTATNLYLEEAREAGLPVLGITGSKGKSTTATLACAVLAEAGRPARLVGNIGTAGLDLFDEVRASGAVTVFEMSSYQTFDLEIGPSVALLLRLFPEHLDWHGGIEPYYAAKCRIAGPQRPDDLTLYNAADAEIVRRLPLGPARHAPFNDPAALHFRDGWFARGSERLFRDSAMRLRGLHNRQNACAALAATEPFGAAPEHLERVLANFAGLPHRLEDIGVHGGIRWINDSISTAPEAAIAALEAFGGVVAAYIGGGADRGFDFGGLARALAAGVSIIVLVPPGGERIREALCRADPSLAERIHMVGDLDAAVTVVARRAPVGTTCLFSPASPSYGVFRNFEERGDTFRRLVARLA